MNSTPALLRSRRTWLVVTLVAAGTAVAAATLFTNLDAALIAGGALALTAVATKVIPQSARREAEANLFKLAAVVPAIALLVFGLADGFVVAQLAALSVLTVAAALIGVLLFGSHRSRLARRIAPAAYSFTATTSSKGVAPSAAQVHAARMASKVLSAA